MPAREARAAVLAVLLQGCMSLPRPVRHADPLTAEQHLQLGTAYEKEGLPDDARKQYESAARSQNVAALIALGNLDFGKGEWRAAAARYRRALRLDPGDPGANNNLAMVLLARGRANDLPRAERLARKALEREGRLKPYVLDTLATVYIRQGREADARRALEEAEASAPPEDPAVREQLAKTRERLTIGR